MELKGEYLTIRGVLVRSSCTRISEFPQPAFPCGPELESRMNLTSPDLTIQDGSPMHR